MTKYPEKNPGKYMYRYKGAFRTEKGARDYQKKLKARGFRTKVVHFVGESHGWSLYVWAKHEFWGRNFVMNGR